MSKNHRSMARIVVMFCLAALAAFAGIAHADDGGWGGGECGKHARHNFKKLAE
jgi:hypothetical protein